MRFVLGLAALLVGFVANASAQIEQKKQVVFSDQAKKQLQVETANLAARKAAEAKSEAQAKRWQDAIDVAVKEKMAARKDLESGPDKLHGGQIVAAIFGAIGASLQNMAAVQAGHAGNYENQALKVIQAKFQQQYDRRLQRVKLAGDELLEARYGAKDADEAHRAALNDLDAKTAAEYKLAEKEALDRLAQLGVPKAQIDANDVVLKLREGAAQHEEAIHQREEQMSGQRAQAAATLKLAEANLGERKGEFRANLGEKREEFKLRREDAAEARAERERLAREKADEKKTNSDKNLEVRDASGIVRGYAPSSRVVKQVQDRVVQYDDSIKALEDLKANMQANPVLGRLPVGDQYNRAVLAVAATTTANSSDATTAHEANTLKNFGLTSPEAVERTLEHQRQRQEAFMRQLRPVEDDTQSRLSLPPPERAPERAPAKTAAPKKVPKLNGADAERMRAARAAGDHRFDAILDQHGF